MTLSNLVKVLVPILLTAANAYFVHDTHKKRKFMHQENEKAVKDFIKELHYIENPSVEQSLLRLSDDDFYSHVRNFQKNKKQKINYKVFGVGS
jgi:hypothetical protein